MLLLIFALLAFALAGVLGWAGFARGPGNTLLRVAAVSSLIGGIVLLVIFLIGARATTF